MILQTDLTLVENFARLQVYYIREKELTAATAFNNIEDIESIILGGKTSTTYLDGINRLVRLVWDNSKNKKILSLAGSLNDSLNGCNIKWLKFCTLCPEEISEEEKTLNLLRIKVLFSLLMDSITIKQAAERTGLNESAIKQACQQDRLLNKRKVGTTWLVSEAEVREYWNLEVI